MLKGAWTTHEVAARAKLVKLQCGAFFETKVAAHNGDGPKELGRLSTTVADGTVRCAKGLGTVAAQEHMLAGQVDSVGNIATAAGDTLNGAGGTRIDKAR